MKHVLYFVFFFGVLILPLVSATVQAQQSTGIDDPERAYLLKSKTPPAQGLKSASGVSVSLPLKMAYQGLLSAAGGGPVADGNYDFTVALYDSQTNGSLQWAEAHAGISVDHGTFNLTLGNSAPLNLQFNKPLFVEIVATNGPAGPAYPLTFSPRSELMSTPYSLAPWVTKGSNIYYNSGKIGIGSAMPESSGIANLKLDIADEDGANGNVAIRVAGQNIDGGGFPQIDFAKSRGTLASPTSVLQNDFLGQVDFFGHDGIAYQQGAGIFAIVDSTPGLGIIPTRLTFYTSNQANGLAKRLQLDRNGSLCIDPWSYNAGNLSPGLTFGDGVYTGEGIASKRSSGGNQWGIDLYTSFAARMSITNGGNIGIGITTPAAKLHVNDSTNSINGSRVMLTQAAGGTTLLDGLALIFTNPNGYVWNYEAGSLLFGTLNSERMRITSTGNVGIGTIAPTERLHVGGGSIRLDNGRELKLQGTGSNPSSLFMGFGTNDLELDNFAAGKISLGTGTTPGSTSQRLIITNDGKVGVGTALPANRLSVLGDADVSGNLGVGTATPGMRLSIAGSMEVGTSAGDYQQLRLGGGNSSGYLYGSWNRYSDGIHMGYNYYANAAGSPVVIASDGATSRLSLGYGYIGLYTGGVGLEPTTLGVYVNSLGNVGIGTSAPSTRLSVAGSICYTGIIGACSDIRYKKEVAALSSSLEKITSLQGVSYYWRSDEFPEQHFSSERQIGLIAQEVEKVYPEIVLTDTKGYKSIDYGHLTAALIEAIKELNGKIIELRQSRDENRALADRLDKLEQLVKSLTSLPHGDHSEIGEKAK